YKGLAITNGLKSYTKPLNILLSERTGKPISDYSNDTIMQENDVFCSTFPKLSLMIRKFGFDNIRDIDSIPITSLSQIIANAYLKQINVIQ
ncbi:hypothetical protein OHW59_17780, partial [Acinetobacter baumannii]|nr:hypothetical protein [Acinetobacter baumannii]